MYNEERIMEELATIWSPREKLAMDITDGIDTLEREIEEWKGSDRTDVALYERLQQDEKELSLAVEELDMLNHIHDGGYMN
jgi:hypothetical protein